MKILQVIQAINTQKSKTNFPLTYNYNARISLTPPNFDIDRTIEAQSQYTRSFTSISITITGLNKIDIYSTLTIDGTGNLPT